MTMTVAGSVASVMAGYKLEMTLPKCKLSNAVAQLANVCGQPQPMAGLASPCVAVANVIWLAWPQSISAHIGHVCMAIANS